MLCKILTSVKTQKFAKSTFIFQCTMHGMYTLCGQYTYTYMYIIICLSCSVFDAMNIPYPARKFLSDDDNKDDKGDKVSYFTA